MFHGAEFGIRDYGIYRSKVRRIIINAAGYHNQISQYLGLRLQDLIS